jgi:hypothetical protein
MADSSTLPGLRSWPQMPPEWWRFFRELSAETTTATVDLSGYLPITTGVSGPMSVRATGTLAAGFVTFQLVNDASAPGNTRYYGTSATGAKGFFPVADALAEGANITLTVGSDGITTIATTAGNVIVPIGVAASDETTALTVGTAKVTFRMPYAFTLTAVRASVTTAPTGAVLTVDVNEAGVSILSTKLTIDATEKTSTTAAIPPVISDTTLADDAEITVDIDTVGSTIAGAGLKVWLIGYKTP